MDSYRANSACSMFASSNNLNASTRTTQDYAIISADMAPDDVYRSYMPDHSQSRNGVVQVEEPYLRNTGEDLQFTYFVEDQAPGHSRNQGGFASTESTYQLVTESKPAYNNIQLTNGYFHDSETVRGLPPAETFSSGTYGQSNAAVSTTTTTPTIRLSPSLNQENFGQSSEYDHAPYLTTSTSDRNAVAYPGEICQSVDLDPGRASESYEAVANGQSWYYTDQLHLQHSQDLRQQHTYTHEEPYISYTHSDSTNQLGYVYSTQPFELSGTVTTAAADATVPDPYNRSALEPPYVIGLAHSEAAQFNRLEGTNFATAEIVYQVEATAADTSYANYPATYEQNPQINPNVYSEFESSAAFGTEFSNQGRYFYENAPVCNALENVSTHTSYAMVSQSDERTIVPAMDSFLWVDPNVAVSVAAAVSTTSTLPEQLNLSTSISWTERNSGDHTQSAAYGFSVTNEQVAKDLNAMQSESNQYTIHGLPNYNTSTGPNALDPDAISHQSLYPQSQTYLSRSAERIPLAGTAACLQSQASFLPDRERPTGAVTGSALRCIHCGREFSRPSHMEIHLRVHTGAQPYSCILCGRQFNQASNLRRHLSSHKTWPPVLPASHCSVPTMDRTTVLHLGNQAEVENSSQFSTKSKQWLCGFCGEQFTSYIRLRGHMVRHKDRRVYACVFDSCSATFTSPESLLAHVVEQHPDPAYTEATTCPTCGRHFHDATRNIQHWLPRRRGWPFRCGIRSQDPHKRNRTGGSNRFYHNYRHRCRRTTTAAIICHTRVINRRHSRKRLSRRPAVQTSSSASPGAVRTQIRLLTLQRPQGTQCNQLYRCPLCPRNCRALNRLRQHLSSSHADTLALAVQQNTDMSVLHPEAFDDPGVPRTVESICSQAPGALNNGFQIRPQSGTARSAAVKPALFLLHVEEGQTEGKKMDPVADKAAAHPVGKSSQSSSSVLCCEHCGRTFQKRKFFHDHQLMCKQIIEERQRRQRLRLHRQMRFREPVPSEFVTLDDATPQVTDPVDVSERPSLGFCQTDDGLRRSQRSKTLRVLWVPRKACRRTKVNPTTHSLASSGATQTSSS